MKYVRQRLARVGERQRHRIEAVTLPGRRRSVGKDVPEMAAAARTNFFHTHHAVDRVPQTADMRLVVRPEKARPPGARVEFRARAEQWQAAEAAGVDPVLVVIQEHAAESGFRAVLEKHAPLIRRQTGRDLCALYLG